MTKKKLLLRKKTARAPFHIRFLGWLARMNNRLTIRYQAFLSRRPHRSFQRTRRRDYTRTLIISGYIRFTSEVNHILKKHWRTFALLVGLYAGLLLFGGIITDQASYSKITSLIGESGKDLFGTGLGKLGEAGLLAVSMFAVAPSDLSPGQLAYAVVTMLFAWLCTVWLLREYLLNRRPRLRDGLYNSGSPVLATAAIVVIMFLQLLPVALMALVYAGLASVGLLDGGFGAMIFWILTACIGMLSLYWMTSSWIALVVVTLPGMYPLRAMRASSDLVIGRRLRILYRLLWGVGIILLGWAIIMIPVILLDALLKSSFSFMEVVPIVPIVASVLTAASVVWFAAYIYILYRRIVDDDAKPA